MVSFAQGSMSSVTTTDRGLVHDREVSFPGDQRVLLGRSYIAWSAVIGGSLTAMAFLILLGSFGSALGIEAYRGGTFGPGAAIWVIGSSIVAFFAGGCLVSYLAPHSEQRSGIVHGMMAWVLTVVLMSVVAALAIGAGGMGLSPLRATMMPGSEVTHGQIVGAAWTAFIGLFFGLLAAAYGGMVGYSGKLVNNIDVSMRQ